MFCSLLVKKVFFLKKRPTDYNPIFLDGNSPRMAQTSPANTYCPLRTINFSNVVDIDNLLVENSK